MVDVSPTQAPAEEWRQFLRVEPKPPMGELIVTTTLIEEWRRSTGAPKPKRPIDKARRAEQVRARRLAKLLQRHDLLMSRAYGYLNTARWRLLSDAANDLRELDVEIRMTEAMKP